MTLNYFNPSLRFLDLIFADKVSRLFPEKRARAVSKPLFNVGYEVKLSISVNVASRHFAHRLELSSCLAAKQSTVSSKPYNIIKP